MEDLFVALESSFITPSDEAGAIPYLTTESFGASWESVISSPFDFEAAELGPTLTTGFQDLDPYFLSPPSVEPPLVDPLIGLVTYCWEVPPTECNIYPTYEFFAGAIDASESDFTYFASPYEGDGTYAADETSQPEFYLEEQEALIHPEITTNTEVDSTGIETETDQTWWAESWWSDPSDNLNYIKRPSILPYFEDNTWTTPKAWWRGAISIDVDSVDLTEQLFPASIALSTLEEPELSIPQSPDLLTPKFDYFIQESNVSSQEPSVQPIGQEFHDENFTTTPELLAYSPTISENIELEPHHGIPLHYGLPLSLQTSAPKIIENKPYSPSAGPDANESVKSLAETSEVDLVDGIQQ